MDIDRSSFGVDFVSVKYVSDLTDVVRAVVLVDPRLHSQADVAAKLDRYIAACQSSVGPGAPIIRLCPEGIDDWTFWEVRDYLAALYATHPRIEGVMFIGNIKLPSFYKPRGDVLQSRLIAHAFEDLDLSLQKLEPGESDADFDAMTMGDYALPELWTAYVPVGYADDELNTYARYAQQVHQFLDKAIAYHEGAEKFSKYYTLNEWSNYINGIAYEMGMNAIDFYAINNTGYGPYHAYRTWDPNFVTPGVDLPADARELFYRRAPIESFPSMAAFNAEERRLPIMGSGWRDASILRSHLDGSHYAIVQINEHSNPWQSILSSDQVHSLNHGGLIAEIAGCGVGGYFQPGSPASVTGAASVDQNLLCAFILGKSDFIAATGDPFNRVSLAETHRLNSFLGQGDYLGLAHYFRKCWQYQTVIDDHAPQDLKGRTQEILLGDPFITLGHQLSPPAPPVLIDIPGSGATITSSPTDHWPAAYCFDGMETTLMRSEYANPAFVTIEFPIAQTIAQIKACLGQIGYSWAECDEWTVDAADNLTDLETQSGSYVVVVGLRGGVCGAWDTSRLGAPVTARVFRFTIWRTIGDDFVHIPELQLYGVCLD